MAPAVKPKLEPATVEGPLISSIDNGPEVPMPTEPPVVAKYALPVTNRLEDVALVMLEEVA